MQKSIKKAKEALAGKGVTIALGFLVLFILIAAFGAWLSGSEEDEQGEEKAEIAVASPASLPTTEAESVTEASDTPVLSPGGEQAPTRQIGSWMQPAEEIARIWGNIDAGKEAWLEGLKPYMDEGTFALYEQMNTDALEQRELTEVRQSETSGEYDQVAVDAYYDGDVETPVMRMVFVPKNDGNYELAMITSPE